MLKEISNGNAILFIGMNCHHFFYILKDRNVSICVIQRLYLAVYARIINKMLGFVRSRGQKSEVLAIVTFSEDSLKKIPHIITQKDADKNTASQYLWLHVLKSFKLKDEMRYTPI